MTSLQDWIEPERFTGDGRILTRRLRQRLTSLEAFAVLLNLGFVVVIFVLTVSVESFEGPPDYNYYLATTHGDFSHYYYAYWLLPVFEVLDALPNATGYLLWGSTAVLGMFAAARIFGGRVPAAMLTYQMVFTTFYGQITGIMVGALALFWWAMSRRKWDTAGFFLVVACSKYHIAGPFALMLWLTANLTWRERFRILLVPLIVGLVSLIAYSFWPLDLLDELRDNPPYDEGSIALWQWIGPLSLLVWLPALLLPMSRGRRIIAISCSIALGLPYFQQADLLILYTLPVGWLALLGNAGFLYFWYTDQALRAMVFIPIVMYLCAVVPALLDWKREPPQTRTDV